MRSPRHLLTSLAAHAVMTLSIALVVGVSGCSAAPQNTEAAAAAKRTVVSFLEAIRRGDDNSAKGLLSTTARTKTEELGISVAPPVEDTATYAVTESEVINEDGDVVHVATTWTDTDDTGAKTTENVVWVVRLDPEGWRVVGMAMRIFEDLPPLLLNFEDPEDMLAKQELVAKELHRRATAGQQPPAKDRTAGKPPEPGRQGPQ